MSRIGNKPITIPDGVEVSLNGNSYYCKISLGNIRKKLTQKHKISVENNVITVTRPNDDPKIGAYMD